MDCWKLLNVCMLMRLEYCHQKWNSVELGDIEFMSEYLFFIPEM